MAQIDLKNCVIRISDRAGKFIDVKIGEGNLTYSEKRNVQYTLNKGNLDEVRLGDQVPMDVSLDAVWEYVSGGVSSAGAASIRDALKQEGAAATWLSTDLDSCRPYAVDLTIIYTPNCDGDSEEVLLADFRVEELNFDLKAGTIAATGKCNAVESSVTREAPGPVYGDELVLNNTFTDYLDHWTDESGLVLSGSGYTPPFARYQNPSQLG